MDDGATYTAFANDRLLASGDLRATLLRTKQALDAGTTDRILIFDDRSGRQVEFDFAGTPDEMLEREAPPKRSGPGRPKLGVVSREVTLLPRHWEWLEQQPSGASGALRRLVDEAIKRDPDRQRALHARDAASRFMWSMAGDLPDFEEASRALFAGDQKRFEQLVREWPKDIRKHLMHMAAPAWKLATADGS